MSKLSLAVEKAATQQTEHVAAPPILPTMRATLTETAADFPDNFSEGEWVAFGQALGRMETADNWWLGDWYNTGARHQYGRLREAATISGRSRAVVKKAAWVSSKLVIRITSLPWHHHYEVAGDSPEDQRRWLERAAAGEGGKPWTIRQLKEARRAEKAAARVAAADDGEAFRTIIGDFRTADIADGSIDWIITDPPYPEDFLPLYGDLSAFAQRVLRRGGSLVAMVGQSYLPAVVALLGERLNYHWTLAYMTPGGQSVQLWDRKVNTFWKPLLWYVNGEYEGKWIGDVARSAVNDNDKAHQEWGQSMSGMVDIVTRMTEPGELILDPFGGAMTTGLAAKEVGRRFIGIEINADLQP